MNNTFTLWEVVTRNGFRKALVKTKNIFDNDNKNYCHGQNIVYSNFSPKFFECSEYFNAGYEIDVNRCQFITERKKKSYAVKSLTNLLNGRGQ